MDWLNTWWGALHEETDTDKLVRLLVVALGSQQTRVEIHGWTYEIWVNNNYYLFDAYIGQFWVNRVGVNLSYMQRRKLKRACMRWEQCKNASSMATAVSDALKAHD